MQIWRNIDPKTLATALIGAARVYADERRAPRETRRGDAPRRPPKR